MLEATIQQAKGVDLLQIVSRYTKLKRTGSEYKGLCPFHEERTPSFSVHPTKGFYCFGCDAHGGNAIDFIMQMENLSFPDAVIRVCYLAGAYVEGPETVPAMRKYIIDTIPGEVVIKNAETYDKNNLYWFLVELFGDRIAGNLCKTFGVGSCKAFGDGTTLFLQLDKTGKCRQLKAILYDENGKRRKDIEPKIIGREILSKYTGRKYDSINLKQCFFNEHTLADRPKDTVAICESEKTAMICHVYYPEFVWLATGGKNGCSFLNTVLEGRDVILFPDMDADKEWRDKIPELEKITKGRVGIVGKKELETKYVNGIPKGMQKADFADFLLLNRQPKGLAMHETGYPIIIDYSDGLKQPI